MAKSKNVEPSKVRAWAASDEGQAAVAAYNDTDEGRKSPAPLHVGDRGRLNPVHRALFEQAHPGERYVVGAFKEPLREFKHKAKDKRGRTITKTAKMTLAEARALIGDTGKGRLDTAAVIEALGRANGVEPDASAPVADGSVEKS